MKNRPDPECHRDKEERLKVLWDLLLWEKRPKREALIESVEEIVGYPVNDRMFYRDLRDLERHFRVKIGAVKDERGWVCAIAWPPRWRGQETGTGLLPPSDNPLAAGYPMSKCIPWLTQHVAQCKRIDRRFTSNRGQYANRGGRYLEDLVRRCIAVVSPCDRERNLEDQVKILSKRSQQLGLLVRKRVPDLWGAEELPTKKECALLRKLLRLRNALLESSPSIFLKRQKEARLVDGLWKGLDSLKAGMLVKIVAALEARKIRLEDD